MTPFSLAAIFFAVLLTISVNCGAARAADITYTGAPADLQYMPPSIHYGYQLSLYPGTLANPLSSGNNVTVNYDPALPGMANPDHVFGGLGASGDARNNRVTVNNGSMAAAYGAFSYYHDVIGNTVTINGGSISETVAGGETFGGSRYAIGNKVYVNDGGGTLLDVYGGIGEGGARDNEVFISGGSMYGVTGGIGLTCVNNVVTVIGGQVAEDVVGAYATGGSGAMSNNVVTISGGSVGSGVMGAATAGTGEITGNKAIVTGGTIASVVRGGLNMSHNIASNNSVEVRGGILEDEIQGGMSWYGDATGNTVTVSAGSVSGGIYGGVASALFTSGITGNGGKASDNKVTITGGIIKDVVYGGDTANGDATDNSVEISGVDIGKHVIGGYSVSGDATGNTVEISSGSTGDSVYGGYSALASGAATGNSVGISGVAVNGGVVGGYNEGGNMTDNTVVINGGSVSGNVYGGYGSTVGNADGNRVSLSGAAIGGKVAGGYTASGSASGNTVTISGGSVGGNVYGGYSANGDATGNTVNIIGAPTLTNANIFGGFNGSGGEAVSGNTFNLMNSQTINAQSISNFENYNFWLPASTANLDQMLVVNNAVKVDGATVDVLLSGSSQFNSGDKVSLISSAGGVTGTAANEHCVATSGSMVEYDFSIYTDGAALWAELARGGALPQSGALTDSRLAGAALLAQGADLAAMLEYFEVSRDKKAVYTGFAAVTGGSSTYDVGMGREIDSDSFALMAGAMWDAPVRKNSLLLRAFVEAGWSDYDTDGTYGAKHVHGDGDANYYGVGIHARYQWTDEKISGLYTDASLRVGRLDSDFSTPDVADNRGVKAAYDTDSAYYGAHIGIGHIWKLNDRTSLDLSSKFLWTHIGSDEFVMSTGDRVELDSVNSSRWRTGLRVTREQSEQLSLFAGAYYEYEFDGDANGRIHGLYHIDETSLSGGTGIGELGLVYRPAHNDRLSAMIGVQGYVGTREGFSGRLKLEYSF